MTKIPPAATEGYRWRPVVAVLSFVLAASLLVVVAAPAAESAVAKPSDRLPDHGALVGMTSWPKNGDWSKNSVQNRWNTIESSIGRTLDIGHWYFDWGADLISWREEWDAQQGRISLISWAQTRVSPVKNGDWDTYIKRQADRVKDFGEPVLIRWFWEMDGDKDQADAESPANYIAAWKRIVGIFRDKNVTNAEFVWCPNAWAFETGQAPQWYPGDAWVDWICADGYNWAPGKPGTQWRSLGSIFSDFHDWAEDRGKPIIIGETAAMEDDPGDKAQWIRDIPSDLANDLPEVDAVVWFDTPVIYGWWIDSTQASLNAFADIVHDPYLNNGLLFGDSFGNRLKAWDATQNAGIDNSIGADGPPSLKLVADRGASWARADTNGGQDAVCVETAFRVKDPGDGSLTLLRIQNSPSDVLAQLFVDSEGSLKVKSVKTDRVKKVGVKIRNFRWYTATVCVTRGIDGNISVALNGETELSWNTRLSNKRIRQIRLGGTGTFSLRFDDVAAWATG